VVSAGSDFVFDGASWNARGPAILVFDEHFIDTNVYSGLAVGAGHRQNLHGIVIGEAGVSIAKKIESLTEQLDQLNKELKRREAAFTRDVLGPLSVDQFCKLPELENLDQKLAAARNGVGVLRDAARVRGADAFSPIGLPLLPDSLFEVLEAGLPDIDAAALAAVGSHFQKLGGGAEAWVGSGVALGTADNVCPFCAQDTTGVEIVGHYRAYFSKAYAAHKARIDGVRVALMEALGGDALVRFQRALQAAKDRRAFWANYFELPSFGIDNAEVERVWVGARQHLASAITKKAGAPLDRVTLSEAARVALDEYRALAGTVVQLGSALLSRNTQVQLAKEKAQHGNLAEEEGHLALLEATSRRFSPECVALVDAYLVAVADVGKAEASKKALRESLAAHRMQAFQKYQTSVNALLRKFNADFRLDGFTALDGRGGLSSQYQIGVNGATVPLAPRGSGPEPSFRTALSAGDRTTLALAVFFVQLHELTGLKNVVAVFDDPVSSLDDHRTHATVDEIAHLMGRVEQLIVLSHSDVILRHLWERAGGVGVASLQICDAGADRSQIVKWDIQVASIDDYDRRHKMVREFAATGSGDAEKVAPALRKLLERFVRVAYNEICPPGTLLGEFLNRARMAAQNGTPVLSDSACRELEGLKNYANRFHHDTNTNWQESITNVNSRELKGFASRVIGFIRRADSV
jgi:wobble nucleotide-excising tRNase